MEIKSWASGLPSSHLPLSLSLWNGWLSRRRRRKIQRTYFFLCCLTNYFSTSVVQILRMIMATRSMALTMLVGRVPCVPFNPCYLLCADEKCNHSLFGTLHRDRSQSFTCFLWSRLEFIAFLFALDFCRSPPLLYT